MEYLAGGSVKSLMKPRPLEDKYISIILKGILQGLDYLHKQGNIHRDVKADNLLVSADGKVKLADFSISAERRSLAKKRFSIIGTPYWMAPEVITNEGYDEKADIWSLGITCIEMAKGNPPHHRLQPTEALKKIIKGDSPSLVGDRHNKQFRDFVSICLNRDPAQRPNAEQLLKHKFIKSAKNHQMLVEVIDRYKKWKASNPQEISRQSQSDDDGGDSEDLWDFSQNNSDLDEVDDLVEPGVRILELS